MGNLDFANQPGFSWYCVFLLVSGVALIVMATLPGVVSGNRIVNIIVGILLAGYGFYLTFIFAGGTYHMFLYVFVLPILLIVNAVKSANQTKATRAAQQRAFMANQQANQAQYAAWQQSQAQAQTQAQAQAQGQQLPVIPGQASGAVPTAQAEPTAL